MFSVIMMTFTFSVPVRADAPSVNYGEKIEICPWENILVTHLPYDNKIKSTKLLSNSNKKVVEVITEYGQVWLKAKKPGTSEVKVLLRLKNGKKKKVRFTVKNVRNVFPFNLNLVSTLRGSNVSPALLSIEIYNYPFPLHLQLCIVISFYVS